LRAAPHNAARSNKASNLFIPPAGDAAPNSTPSLRGRANVARVEVKLLAAPRIAR